MSNLKESERRAVFLDRDGIINEKLPEGSYVTSWEGFIFIDRVREAISLLSKTNYQIIVVTNQRAIAKGLMRPEDLQYIHTNMVEKIREYGGRIDKIYTCPHEIGQCSCRKPLAGMLDKAKEELGVILENSWVIGDSSSDIKMGKSRKCKTIYIGENNTESDYVSKTLYEAVEGIILK